MSRINPDLDTMIEAFKDVGKGNEKVTDEMIANLRACIESSPALAEQMNRAVAEGHLKVFALMKDDGLSAGALYFGKEKKIELPAKALSDKFDIHDMAFVLGHETQHGFNHAERTQLRTKASGDIRTIARDGNLDNHYDAPIADLIQAGRWDEGKSSLAGWNAAVSQLKNEGKEVTLDAMSSAYQSRAPDFVDPVDPQDFRKGYRLKDGITLNDDMTVDVDDPQNIAALGKYYHDRENRTVGHAKSSYANYTGISAISTAVYYQRKDAPAESRMLIDMQRHGLSEEKLEINGMNLQIKLNKQLRQPYTDTSHGQEQQSHFDHTVDARVSPNQVQQYVPIAPAMTPSRRRRFDDPDHPDHALHEELKASLPPETSPNRLAQITLAASRGGIKAGQIAGMNLQDDALYLRGRTSGDGARIDLTTPPPSQDQTLREFDQLNEQRQQQVQQWQQMDRQANLTQQQNPVLSLM